MGTADYASANPPYCCYGEAGAIAAFPAVANAVVPLAATNLADPANPLQM